MWEQHLPTLFSSFLLNDFYLPACSGASRAHRRDLAQQVPFMPAVLRTQLYSHLSRTDLHCSKAKTLRHWLDQVQSQHQSSHNTAVQKSKKGQPHLSEASWIPLLNSVDFFISKTTELDSISPRLIHARKRNDFLGSLQVVVIYVVFSHWLKWNSKWLLISSRL